MWRESHWSWWEIQQNICDPLGKDITFHLLWGWTPLGCASGCEQHRTPTWTFHFSLFSLFSLLHHKGVVNILLQREESELGSAQGNNWPGALTIQVFYWHQGLISCNWIVWEVLHCPGVTLALLWITSLSVIRVFLQPTPIQLQALTEIKEEEFRFQLAYLLGKCFFYS